jgi:CRISPR-associated endonuclease/helicase Cas3
MGKTNSAEPKSERIIQIQLILMNAPHGKMSVNDMAAKTGVSTDTIYRYIRKNILNSVGIQFENGWLEIDRNNALIRVGLNLDEAMALHLATRLLATRMDRRNTHASTAISKLSQAIEPISKPVSRMMRNTADDLGSLDKWSEPGFIEVIEVLTEAIAWGRKVRITYFTERIGEERIYTLSPYWLEPYAVGKSIYVVGPVDDADGIQIFKVDRIQSVDLTLNTYEIPESFNPQKLFKDAWGIWFSGGKKERVVLRFSPAKAARVKQSRWHPSESFEDQEDGSLIWSAEVVNWTEMLPWIHGWGAGVEVLEPHELRQKVIEEVFAMVDLYKDNKA